METNNEQLKEGDLVLCKVKKVTNTITFVELPNGQEGTIIPSEIAAGRIKLMRQYVVPNKQIVCKVLQIEGDHAHLSLRRVTSKEKKDVLQKFKQSQAISVAFKQILKDQESETKEKILENFETLEEFFDKIKCDETLIEKYIPKEHQESIKKIINKRKKEDQLKQSIKIKCLEDDGILKIKQIFDFDNQNIKVNYVSAGQFTLTLEIEDFKQGKKEMADILEEIEKRAKENKCEFFAKEIK